MLKFRFVLTLFFITGLLFTVSPTVQAADFSASTAQELIDAINTANANAEADTITLTADITLTVVDNNADFVDNTGNAGADGNEDGANGLPLITSDIMIEGNNFTIARDAGAPEFRIFAVSSAGALTLNTVTLSNGAAVNSSSSIFDDDGGAILNFGDLTINNSMLSGNSASNVGGGIYNFGPVTLTLTNSTLSNNSAEFGGGIYNFGPVTLTLTNSTLSNNSASFVGGGILNSGTATITLNNSTLSNNSARDGGGILNSGTATLNNSTLSNNSAARDGGGIYNSGTATLNNSTLSNNSAEFGGGIYNFGTATLTLNNSTLSNNSASSLGGGIHNIRFGTLAGTLTLNNSTLSGNSASSGGGIYNDGTATITNSIIANSPSGGDYVDSGTPTTNGNNIVADGSLTASANVLNVDPQLGALGDNGGSTQTHALQSGSPAINGSGAGATSNDQRGAPAVGTRDIGAFEFDGTVPQVSFSIDEPTLTEFGTITQATVTITVTDYSQPFDVSFAFTGTVNSSDYTTSYSGPYTINSNGDTTFTIDIVDDIDPESTEDLELTLLLQGSADVVAPSTQTIQFIDNPPPPTFAKIFTPDTIPENGISTLTFTIDNPVSPTDATDLDFTDNLPAGTVVATPANASTTCTGGTLTADDGTAVIAYTGGTVSAGATCTITVDIEGVTVGTHTNTSGDLTSSLGNSGSASADITITALPEVEVENNTETQSPSIGIFDPTISKIGLLVPGDTGVIGEQLEWITTVSNNGTVVGNNVTIVDNVDPRLQVNRVDAPNATVTIDGNTVSVTYATLNSGETVQFSIFTTVLDGVSVDNTVCIDGTDICATGSAVSQLPNTGETPLSRTIALTLLGGLMILGAFGLVRKQIQS